MLWWSSIGVPLHQPLLFLSMRTLGETRIVSSEPRNGFLYPFLAKAFAPRCPDSTVARNPEDHYLVFIRQGTNCLLKFPDQLWRYPCYFKGSQSCLAFWANIMWRVYVTGHFWTPNMTCSVLETPFGLLFWFIYDFTSRHYNLFLQCALTLWRCVLERSWFLCSGPLISLDLLLLSAFLICVGLCSDLPLLSAFLISFDLSLSASLISFDLSLSAFRSGLVWSGLLPSTLGRNRRHLLEGFRFPC
jgi:hypothetical protein